MSEFDRLFKSAEPRAVSLAQCPECQVWHKPSLRGEARCEVCRMDHVRRDMAKAVREGTSHASHAAHNEGARI